MFHLAQVNIARARFPLADPAMHGFVSRLDEINTLAESSPAPEPAQDRAQHA